jgi:hypothetical protein
MFLVFEGVTFFLAKRRKESWIRAFVKLTKTHLWEGPMSCYILSSAL